MAEGGLRLILAVGQPGSMARDFTWVGCSWNSGPVAEIPEHEGRVSDWASEDGPPPRTSRSGSNIRPQALRRLEVGA